ncbi:MAG: DUF2335 domain-containing protein [archaeon]
MDREQLPKELKEIIQYIPDDKKDEALKVITAQSIEHSTSFSGPLPPPSILDEYNNVLDNGAERIMKMAENQSNHRIEMEKHAIKEELRQSKTGQNFGFILAIIGMIIAFLLAYLGHDTVAGIFGTTTIVGLVTIFVIGKKRQDKELEE